MDEPTRIVYDRYKEKLQDLLLQASTIKKMLNQMALDVKEEPEFPDVEVEKLGARGLIVKPGQFFNKPLAGSVKEYLALVEKARGIEGVAFSEIFDALRRGSFGGLKTKVDEDEKELSIKKNSAAFVMVDEDHIGLKEWFPAKEKDAKKSNGKRPRLPKPKPSQPKKKAKKGGAKGDTDPSELANAQKGEETETPKQ